MKEITYVSEIVEVLKELNGYGSLKEINEGIEKRDILPNIHTNINWERNVSSEIQRHCKETKSYRGAKNIFFSVYGLGEGYWGLLDYETDIDHNDINPIDKRLEKEIKDRDDITDTEKEMLIKARVGQGIFRDRIIDKYNSCIITGISDSRLLLASHIKPWRSANNVERLSKENGLLLSPLYDKLFDIGLITFSKDMKVIISPQVNKSDISKLYLDTDFSYIKNPSTELKVNMEYHRDIIFQK